MLLSQTTGTRESFKVHLSLISQVRFPIDDQFVKILRKLTKLYGIYVANDKFWRII
jgi:hypothetical protein